MTPIQLKTLCDTHGGQVAISRLVPYTKDHINKMIRQKHPITERASKIFELTFPDFFQLSEELR